MTILRDATAINDGTTAIMAVSLRNHGDNGGATAVYAVQAPQCIIVLCKLLLFFISDGNGILPPLRMNWTQLVKIL